MALSRMKVFLFLADPAGTTTAGYDRIAIEVSEDFGSTWEEHSDDDSELRIEIAKYNYHYILNDGGPELRYRAVIRDSNEVQPDVPQSPVQAIDVAFEALITIEELKTIHLFSIDLTGDDGTPYPDELFAHFITAAIAQMEMEFDICAFVRKFEAERYDWWARDWEQFGYLKLNNKPIKSVETLEIAYPNQGAGESILSLPKEWIVIDSEGGSLNIYPGSGTMATSLLQLGGGGYIPFLMNGSPMLPGLIRCTYFAGIPPSDRRVPLLKEYAGKLASMGPLNIAGDLVAGAGIAAQSISIDGLSRSITTSNSSTNAGYGARIIQWQKELKGMKGDMKRHFGGLRMTAV